MNQFSTQISISLALSVLLGIFAFPPIILPVKYHAFSDSRLFWEIPNFLEVISNGAFVLAGLYLMSHSSRLAPQQRIWARTFSLGLILTGMGSGHYHWNPNNDTLVWDRLPMILSFAGVMGMMASERISTQGAKYWGSLWGILGLVSLWLIQISGDMRLYAVIQGGGFLLLTYWCFLDSKLDYTLRWGYLLLAYGIAKLCELNDSLIWELTQGVTDGHTWKHIFAAIGPMLTIQKKSTAKAVLELKQN